MSFRSSSTTLVDYNTNEPAPTGTEKPDPSQKTGEADPATPPPDHPEKSDPAKHKQTDAAQSASGNLEPSQNSDGEAFARLSAQFLDSVAGSRDGFTGSRSNSGPPLGPRSDKAQRHPERKYSEKD